MADSNLRLFLILSVLCFSYVQLNAYIANEIAMSPRMATERSIDSSYNSQDMVLGAPLDGYEAPNAYYTELSLNVSENLERPSLSERRQVQGKRVIKTLASEI